MMQALSDQVNAIGQAFMYRYLNQKLNNPFIGLSFNSLYILIPSLNVERHVKQFQYLGSGLQN